ncbi:MAG: GNAT family N-acetyltransferase, partial [Roseovarius sp.]|nr:GNAT family N-acetyltransferase [Roseovarius sp.]
LVGFTQLFPSFSSVSASRTFVLNDLFVVPEARRKGVAQALLAKAVQVGRALGVASLSLSTARANEQAQKLYESQGWKQDDFFLHYSLAL